MSHGQLRTAAIPTIKRLPLYLRSLRDLHVQGEAYASSAALARELMLDPIVVRKDLAITGVVGTPRRGFPVDALISAIVEFLGWSNTTDAFLCGVGSLGRALLGDEGFQHYGLRIVAAFDTSPQKIGTRERGVEVFDMAKMPAMIRRMHIQLGILTVPAEAAQPVANTMIEAGIRGIWNFTPVQLEVPDTVVIPRVDLASSLAVLSHRRAVAAASR
jgi:redox-sensing transcriptional repressor